MLLVCLLGAIYQNNKVNVLREPIGNRTNGHYQFTATLLDRSEESISLKNTSSGEVLNVSTGGVKVSGSTGTATITLRGQEYPALVRWSPITISGGLLGTVTAKQGDYAQVNGKWYRINTADGYIGSRLIGKTVYGNDSIDRIDP